MTFEKGQWVYLVGDCDFGLPEAVALEARVQGVRYKGRGVMEVAYIATDTDQIFGGIPLSRLRADNFPGLRDTPAPAPIDPWADHAAKVPTKVPTKSEGDRLADFFGRSAHDGKPSVRGPVRVVGAWYDEAGVRVLEGAIGPATTVSDFRNRCVEDPGPHLVTDDVLVSVGFDVGDEYADGRFRQWTANGWSPWVRLAQVKACGAKQ